MKNLTKYLVFSLLIAGFSLFAVSCKNNADDSSSSSPLPEVKIVDCEILESVSYEDFKSAFTSANSDVEDFAEMLTALDEEVEDSMQEILDGLTEEDLPEGCESVDELKQELTSDNFSAMCQVATFKVLYETKSADGSTITASMRILANYMGAQVFGKDLRFFAKSDQIVLDDHCTICQNKQCPTEDKGMASENGLMYKIAFSDNMVVSPDYEGYGETENRVHPYLIGEATARQCVDAVIAAIKWKKDYRGLEKDFDMYTFGASQGGAVALGVQNYIQNKGLTDELHFRGATCSSGPYDPVATYNWNMKNGIWMPCVMPLILRAYTYYYPELKGTHASDFFNEKICTELKHGTDNEWYLIDCKEFTTNDINRMLFRALGYPTTQEFINADEMMKKDIKKEHLAALLACLEKNNYCKASAWKGGKPALKFFSYHSVNDDVVPFVNTDNLQKAFPDQCIVVDYGHSYWEKHSDKRFVWAESLGKVLDILSTAWEVPKVPTEEETVARKPFKHAHVAYCQLFFVSDVIIHRCYKDVKDKNK